MAIVLILFFGLLAFFVDFWPHRKEKPRRLAVVYVCILALSMSGFILYEILPVNHGSDSLTSLFTPVVGTDH